MNSEETTSLHFSDLPLAQELRLVLEELNYQAPTPVQAQSLPLLLAGKDLMAQSKTGSGKTLAFALPLLNKINLELREVQALVLCPTRELAAQVQTEIRKLGRRYPGLQVLSLVGGQVARPQTEALAQGVHVVVGTPGRVLDHLEHQRLNLLNVSTVVLDEADKMLEMGFENELQAIMGSLPPRHQTALFSATFAEGVQSLSRRYQTHPHHVRIEDDASEQAIEQVLYEMDSEGDTNKVHILMRVLQQHPSTSTIIFCNMKSTANEVLEELQAQGADAGALHGDLEQRDRDRMMTLFRNGSLRLLVTTDVAARGLDIDHLELVINYDLPSPAETYVHRIGRTGRAGKTGTAVTLAHSRDILKIKEFEKATGARLEPRKLGFKNQHGLSPALCEAAMKTLSISGGRKEKLRPGDILGALTGGEGLMAADIGKIDVLDRWSYVAIRASQAEKALRQLRDGKIKGRKFQIRRVEA